MSYEIKRLKDVPAIVATFHADFDPATELEPVIIEMRQIISEEASPIYVIMDLSTFTISLNDLFVGTGVGMRSRDTVNRTQAMENTIKTIIVTEQKLLRASMKGFERFGFGKELDIVSSVDEALQVIKNAA